MRRIGIAFIILAVLMAGGVFFWKYLLPRWYSVESDDEPVYFVSVAELNGQQTALGVVDRFSGVVEAQKTWSVNQNPDSTIKEILVSVGDEVKKGDPLFTYDTEKYKSDQEQAEIELERMVNELESLTQTIEKLQKDQTKAPVLEQADYTIRIQDAELQKKQKELEIRSKNLTITKLRENQENDTVFSGIDGVVRSINNGTGYRFAGDNQDSAFITIMKTDDLRIKGTVNEQNIGQLMIGAQVIVHSRVDDSEIWMGMVSEINTEKPLSEDDNYYGSGERGSNYNFYVDLEDISGLMIGQHVYVEPDVGQLQTESREGIWIPVWYVSAEEPEHPYVLTDDGTDRTEKREVETGEIDSDRMMIQIQKGLSKEDRIALPQGSNVDLDESAFDELEDEGDTGELDIEEGWGYSEDKGDWNELNDSEEWGGSDEEDVDESYEELSDNFDWDTVQDEIDWGGSLDESIWEDPEGMEVFEETEISESAVLPEETLISEEDGEEADGERSVIKQRNKKSIAGSGGSGA